MDDMSNSKPEWQYNPNLLCIHHRNSDCRVCSEFLVHLAMAFTEVNSSWTNADAKRTQHLVDKFGKSGASAELLQKDAKISELTGSCTTLKLTIEQLRSENTSLSEDRSHYRSRYRKLDEDNNELVDTLHSRDDEIHKLRREIDELKKSGLGDHIGKKRKFAPGAPESIQSAPSYSPSIDTDRSDSPIGFILSPDEAAQIAALSQTQSYPYSNASSSSTLLPPPTYPTPFQSAFSSLSNPSIEPSAVAPRRRPPPTEPVTVAQVDEYFRNLRNSELPNRKPAWPVFRMLELARAKALDLPETSSIQTSRVEAHHARQAAEHAAAVQRKAEAKPPPITANDDIIVRWLCHQSPEKSRGLLGVFKRQADNAVSLRSIRGRRLVYTRDASYESSAVAIIRYAFVLTAIEVIITPLYYRDYITNNGVIIQFPRPAITGYPSDPRNITTTAVCQFFASQGLFIEEVEDAAFFAYHWLTSAQIVNPDILPRLTLIRNRVYPLLLVHGLPAGTNEDYMTADGNIIPHPSMATPGNLLTGIPTVPNLSVTADDSTQSGGAMDTA
ncbi:hypothetical protein EV361DRAFT_1035070 [Lentinula raphanica]|nr:hypothetical protein EV361DRAFT_1035070 [Lentinula raphanica]